MSIIEEIKENPSIVLKHLKEVNDVKYVYMTGSLLEGFGNEKSDIDIYVICDIKDAKSKFEQQENSISIHLEDKIINNINFNGYRFDFEYWDIKKFVNLISKLNNYDFTVEQFNSRFTDDEIDFLHRLKNATPLVNSQEFKHLQNNINFKHLSGYQIIEYSETFDNHIEDLEGAVLSKDFLTVYRLSLIILEISINSYLSTYNQTNPSKKWFLRKIKNYEEKNNHDELLSKYLNFNSYKFDQNTILDFMDSIIDFTTTLNKESQYYLNKLQRSGI